MKDSNNTYSAKTQTTVSETKRTLVDQDTGEVMLVDQIIKRVYGTKQFWKVYLTDFLSILGIIDSKQLDVFIYIVEHTSQSDNLNTESIGATILRDFQKEIYNGNQQDAFAIYSFNYPFLNDIYQKYYDAFNAKDYGVDLIRDSPFDVGYLNIDFMHGCAKENDNIIFGIDNPVTENEEVNRAYAFLIKSNHSSYRKEKKKYLLSSLSRADQITFFGFSFSKADKQYYEDFFKLNLPDQSKINNHRIVKIYTFDKSSAEKIIANIKEVICPSNRFFNKYIIEMHYH